MLIDLRIDIEIAIREFRNAIQGPHAESGGRAGKGRGAGIRHHNAQQFDVLEADGEAEQLIGLGFTPVLDYRVDAFDYGPVFHIRDDSETDRAVHPIAEHIHRTGVLRGGHVSEMARGEAIQRSNRHIHTVRDQGAGRGWKLGAVREPVIRLRTRSGGVVPQMVGHEVLLVKRT